MEYMSRARSHARDFIFVIFFPSQKHLRDDIIVVIFKVWKLNSSKAKQLVQDRLVNKGKS